MNTPDTFSIAGLDVSVEETPSALIYSFTRRIPEAKPLALGCLGFVLIGYPCGILSVLVYALIEGGANRPVWELVLTAVFMGQLFTWVVFIGWVIIRTIQGSRSVLAFRGEGVWHGSNRICELGDIRGLRLFIYPMRGDSPGKLRAALSLVIGDESLTYGLVGRLRSFDLRTFAEEMQRRLAAFRWNQGLMSPLDPLDVVETTRDVAIKLVTTHPSAWRTLRGRGVKMLLERPRLICSICYVMMLPGLCSSARLLLFATDLNPIFLAGHIALLITPPVIIVRGLKTNQ